MTKVDNSPLAQQVGGSHYKDLMIQPIEYSMANNLGYIESTVIKYITRWKSKGGVEDLRKARHFLDILIEKEVHGMNMTVTMPPHHG
jgi:hypothetical protein